MQVRFMYPGRALYCEVPVVVEIGGGDDDDETDIVNGANPVGVLECSSNRQGATKLNPRNNSWAFALGGTPGESTRTRNGRQL